MAIKIECGDCGKTYTLKDEMEGKKIRCKECSALIVVQSEDDWNDEVEEEYLPPVRKSSKKKTRRRSSSDGIPVPVIVGLVCIGLMVAVSLLDLVGGVVLLVRHPAHPPQLIGMCLGILIRIAIQVTAFAGVMNGTASTRIVAIVLAVLATLMLGVQMTRVPQQVGQEFVIPLLAFSIFIRVVFIGCMLTPSAGDHMQE